MNIRRAEDHEMRLVYGPGPDGKRCKTCVHLIRKIWGDKRYLKCAYRIHINGPGTDHRAGWLACSKYEEDVPDET